MIVQDTIISVLKKRAIVSLFECDNLAGCVLKVDGYDVWPTVHRLARDKLLVRDPSSLESARNVKISNANSIFRRAKN